MEANTVSDPFNDHSARWVLNNGTKVWALGNNYTNANTILFYMDTKLGGNSTYVTDGAPMLSFICNVTDTTTTSGGASGGTNTIRTLKAGKCGPWVGGWETQWDFLYK